MQELKEKAINYRLETQDFMAEYKLRADSKVPCTSLRLELSDWLVTWSSMCSLILSIVQNIGERRKLCVASVGK